MTNKKQKMTGNSRRQGKGCGVRGGKTFEKSFFAFTLFLLFWNLLKKITGYRRINCCLCNLSNSFSAILSHVLAKISVPPSAYLYMKRGDLKE